MALCGSHLQELWTFSVYVCSKTYDILILIEEPESQCTYSRALMEKHCKYVYDMMNEMEKCEDLASEKNNKKLLVFPKPLGKGFIETNARVEWAWKHPFIMNFGIIAANML